MSLHHGENITADEVEREISRFGARIFVSLCNSIVWAASKRRSISLPSFTERINVKDSGIDGEWVESHEDVQQCCPFLKPGRNVFQYKQRDIFARDRNDIVSGLRSGLMGAISEVLRRHGKVPDHYVLFTNVDLSHEQKQALKTAVLDGCESTTPLTVEVVGAGELAAILNDLPHIRSAFFLRSRFAIWQDAWSKHTEAGILKSHVEMIGRTEQLESLRKLIDDTEVRAIVLYGPHQIGKTRLALEATRHRRAETVVSIGLQWLSPAELSAFAVPGMQVVLIVEAPEPQAAEELLKSVLATTGLKLVVTLPAVERIVLPNFGRDERVRCFRVEPLSNPESEKLLKAAGAKFDYSLESWVIHQAAGNPGVLLMAANIGEGLRKSTTPFLEAVSQAFEQKARQELGDKTVDVLALLSLLTYVGISGNVQSEIRMICDLFGTFSVNDILNAVPKLEAAGLLRLEGSYAAVQPPPLASRLAASALRGRLDQLVKLYARLGQNARKRLVRRLAYVKAEEADIIWDAFFSPGGCLENLQVAFNDPDLLHLVSGIVPERVAILIHTGLANMTVEERLAIEGRQRRELMWALEQLLFRRHTSASALRSIALLAEAENEHWGNNATGVFCECFSVFHAQMPLPLADRVQVLQEISSPTCSQRLRSLAVKAIAKAFGTSAGSVLRQSDGIEPLDSRPRILWREVFDYSEALLDILLELAGSGAPETSQQARGVIPQVIAQYSTQGRPERVVERLKGLTERVLSGELVVDVADFTSALSRAHEAYAKGAKDAEANGQQEDAGQLRKLSEEVGMLSKRLENADFAIRLKRWAGRWTHLDDEEVGIAGEKMSRHESELRRLAAEAVESLHILTVELTDWLCSDKAHKAYIFFWWLGRLDVERKLIARVEAIGENDKGSVAFGYYFGGMARRDPAFVRGRVAELAEGSTVSGLSLVRALAFLNADTSAVDVLEKLLVKGRVSPRPAEQILACGRWAEPLSSHEFLRLLRVLHGGKAENTTTVLDFLAMWLHMDKPLEGDLAEFAWQCLESLPVVKGTEGYDCDRVASVLAEREPERGFRLLKTLLTQRYDFQCWYPVEHRTHHLLWDTLTRMDRERALDIAVGAAASDTFLQMRLADDLAELIDPASDADILIKMALDSKERAIVVCECLSVDKPGFWPLAFRLLEVCQNDAGVEASLSRSVFCGKRVITGPMSSHLASRAQAVSCALSEPNIPAHARAWLEKLQSDVKQAAEEERVREADRDVKLFS